MPIIGDSRSSEASEHEEGRALDHMQYWFDGTWHMAPAGIGKTT